MLDKFCKPYICFSSRIMAQSAVYLLLLVTISMAIAKPTEQQPSETPRKPDDLHSTIITFEQPLSSLWKRDAFDIASDNFARPANLREEIMSNAQLDENSDDLNIEVHITELENGIELAKEDTKGE